MYNTNMTRLIMTVALLITGLLSTSCIRDSYEDCPRPFRLFIKAIDADMNDITSSGEVQQVMLFVFNEKQEIVKSVRLDAEHIKSVKPVDIKLDYPGHRSLQFIAWGNTGSNENFPDINAVKELGDLYASLKNGEIKAGESGKIAQSPGDLFYGNLEAPVEYGGFEPSGDQTVVISRKTSQVNIMAYGLKQWNYYQEGLYTYELRESHDTYDEYGNLTGEMTGYEPAAEMDSKGNLSAPTFNTFPTSDNKPYTLYIRYNGEVIYTTNKDSEGQLFIPETGRLLNIILRFRTFPEDPSGISYIEIKSVVTLWNQVFQYVEQ